MYCNLIEMSQFCSKQRWGTLLQSLVCKNMPVNKALCHFKTVLFVVFVNCNIRAETKQLMKTDQKVWYIVIALISVFKRAAKTNAVFCAMRELLEVISSLSNQ